MSSKLLGAFRETLKVEDDSPSTEPAKHDTAGGQLSTINADTKSNAKENQKNVKRRRTPRQCAFVRN